MIFILTTLKKKYNGIAKILFTDTDSFTYEIETEDANKDFWSDKDKFVNSEYPETPQISINQIKKVIGKFEGEASGIPIKRNFNSCSSKTLRKRQKSHRINNFTLLRKNLADKFP